MLLLRYQEEEKDSEDVERYADDVENEFVARNGRRPASYTAASPDTQSFTPRPMKRSIDSAISPVSSTLGAHHRHESLSSPSSISYYVDNQATTQSVNQNQEVANETAAALFKAPINTPGDALHLLLEASGRSENFQHQGSSDGEIQQITPSPELHSLSHTRFTRPGRPASVRYQKENIDPAIASGELRYRPDPPDVTIALRTWSRLRFVRAGWFTAREAIYYEYLAPLTPISPPEFRSPETHPRFLADEPLLAVTVLTIASRYKQLSGPGCESRSYMVHERLWSYLQNMITRMFWGQEQFGGGFCGAGPRKIRSTANGGLRTLGTIESLLLLSEFHPRSMHFPPGDDGDDILTTADDESATLAQAQTLRETPAFGEATVASWSEPALRSDRMCWSLIGMAYTLAYELGVFGNFQNGTRILQSTERLSGESSSSPQEQRADRIERLLYVYVNSACGRFGFPSMYAARDDDLDLHNIQTRMTSRPHAQSLVDNIQECWIGITLIMKACNASIFPSRDHAQALIQSGEYMALLEQLQPTTNAFEQRLEAAQIPKYAWIILSIELEYIRLYIFSLALQAVLGHWTSSAAPGNDEQTNYGSFPALYRRNEVYITEVVKAARNLLRLVVEGLLPDNYLKHAPVRTHFRILSGAMFLLKVGPIARLITHTVLTPSQTFALGAKEDEVSLSLDLLDKTVRALRTSVVDDVHLCLRIADLLEGLTSSIRHKFVRLPARNPKSNTGTPPHHASYAMASSPGNSLSASNLPTQAYTGVNPSNAPDNNNISFVPPPDPTYHYNLNLNNSIYPTNATTTANNNAYNNNNNNNALSPFPATNNNNNNNEEDWLTLDLNPLLSSSTDPAVGFQTGVGLGNDGQWFGDFGPEINGNLEVLGRLVDGWDTTTSGGLFTGAGAGGAFS
ncbi:MAG: hypothetical protein LQ350_008070 [Teloschistes chrysophthalmus]|nr:MAG: hypothetical protein LQ350_008070 [Niorma chrysophthalma]